MFSGWLTDPDDIVIPTHTIRDVKLVLISEDSTAREITMFQNLCEHVCRKLRSKLFTTCCKFLDYLSTVLDTGSSAEFCRKSSAASITLYLLRISTASDSLMQAYRTQSTSSSDLPGCPRKYIFSTVPVSLNCLYHFTMLLSSGYLTPKFTLSLNTGFKFCVPNGLCFLLYGRRCTGHAEHIRKDAIC
jgi:hypothetical protein